MPKATPPIPRKVIVISGSAGSFPDGARSWRGDSVSGVYEIGKPVHVDLMTDPLLLIETCAQQFRAAGEGNLILDRPLIEVFDDGDHPRQLRAFIDVVKTGGWEAGAGAELGSGWITFTRSEHPAVHVGIRAMMPPEERMLIPELDPEHAAVRLCEYAKLIGASYRATPGVSAVAALRNVYSRPKMLRRAVPDARQGYERVAGRRLQPTWIWNRPEPLVSCGDLHYQRKPYLFETKCDQVIAFDMRAAYLAAAASMKLAWDTPRNTGAIMWDPGLAGFYRIDTAGQWWAAHSNAFLPIVNPLRVESDGSAWVTHPIMAYLSEIGEPLPAILDSWTAPAREWVLREWAEQLRDALPDWRTAGDEGLRKLIKASYVEAFGMMGRPGGRVYRDDWRWCVIDETRIRMIRKLSAAQLALITTPLKVKVDCAWYPVTAAVGDMLQSLGADPDNTSTIGQFKVDRKHSGSMADFLTSNRIQGTLEDAL